MLELRKGKVEKTSQHRGYIQEPQSSMLTTFCLYYQQPTHREGQTLRTWKTNSSNMQPRNRQLLSKTNWAETALKN